MKDRLVMVSILKKLELKIGESHEDVLGKDGSNG